MLLFQGIRCEWNKTRNEWELKLLSRDGNKGLRAISNLHPQIHAESHKIESAE